MRPAVGANKPAEQNRLCSPEDNGGQLDKNRTPVWKDIASAPFDQDLQLAVIDRREEHSLVFPCRRILGGWVKSKTRQRIDVQPTHWREWSERDPPGRLRT